jgi:hypothetical protein
VPPNERSTLIRRFASWKDFARSWPRPRLDRPVFLTGCGRSGTTILGTTLSQHPLVTYLNEPRDLWVSGYPQTDIWSPEARRRNGALIMTAAVCSRRRNRRLRRLFASAIVRGRPRLIEKLPINNFRLGFIRAVFPDALFVHIVRNGLDVADSIARRCAEGGWFGVNDYKWERLVEYAESRAEYRHLPTLCRTDFERGLLEWRLSVETARGFYASLPKDRNLEVTYEALLRETRIVLERIESFVGLPPDELVHAFGDANIRRSAEPARRAANGSAQAIAGDLLADLGYGPAGL